MKLPKGARYMRIEFGEGVWIETSGRDSWDLWDVRDAERTNFKHVGLSFRDARDFARRVLSKKASVAA
jgi:hypothetical protein